MSLSANYKKVFVWFLLINGIVWSLVPLLRMSLPMDTQEAIVWGKFCLWGTTKHPPFSGWLAYPFWRFFGQWDGAMYLLSQICVALGVVYIYRLACCFMKETHALLAALLQFGVIYYNFSSVEFNVNVVSLALWPMCAFYFWRAYTRDWWIDWLLFGALVGLNLLNKYVGGVLLVAIGIFVILDKNIIKLIKNIKVYLAIVVALKLVAPHVWWLWQNDFEALNYITSRHHGGTINPFLGHIVYPLKFLGAQLLFAAPALLTYAWFNHKYGLVKSIRNIFWLECDRQRSVSLFILCMAVIPVTVFALICLISGNAAKSMWGFPCLFMWGTALIYFVPLKEDETVANKLLKVMFGWSVLFAVVYGAQCVLTKSARFRTNCPQLAQKLVQEWINANKGAPIEYVGGDVWFADMVTLYGGAEIKPMIWLSPKNNPWFDADDFYRKGALVVASDVGEYAVYQAQYNSDLSEPQSMEVNYQNYLGQSKPKTIFYGFLQPKEVENGK